MFSILTFKDQFIFCKDQIHFNAQFVADFIYNFLKMKGNFLNFQIVKMYNICAIMTKDAKVIRFAFRLFACYIF